MSTVPTYPRIPYGEASFSRIRLNRWLYVDKTRFLRRLEQERYAFLIRPRRFGKSLWVSLLESYYDRFWADRFDATFAGTDVGCSPTVLIDEYDNFANTVLACHGAEAYHSFTHGGGFYLNFFAVLKGGADRAGGGLASSRRTTQGWPATRY